MVLSANGRPSDSQSENKGSIPLRTEYVKRNKIIVWCYHLVGRSVEGSIPLWAIRISAYYIGFARQIAGFDSPMVH